LAPAVGGDQLHLEGDGVELGRGGGLKPELEVFGGEIEVGVQRPDAVFRKEHFGVGATVMAQSRSR
jgi:hypothetical protein